MPCNNFISEVYREFLSVLTCSANCGTLYTLVCDFHYGLMSFRSMDKNGNVIDLNKIQLNIQKRQGSKYFLKQLYMVHMMYSASFVQMTKPKKKVVKSTKRHSNKFVCFFTGFVKSNNNKSCCHTYPLN